MSILTIEQLKQNKLIVFEAISGSRAYGLDTPESDTDIKGVFVVPKNVYYSLDSVIQLNNETNDIVYYELHRFTELITKNNPNILELLAIPGDCILKKHPFFDVFQPEKFLSKLCFNSFAGYAMTQVKKAKGLKKKIVNPVAKERKSALDFCYVIQGHGSIPVKQFLLQKKMEQERCGLSKIPHMHDLFGLYYNKALNFSGIIKKDNANEVALSSIPKDLNPIAVMSFNKSGFSTYCKEYKEYWDWVEKRNDTRYENTLSHGKNYDAKNMMHTFRLLAMAKEIGEQGKIIVKRPDRDFLLQIKSGEFEYDELVKMAENRMKELETVYKKSSLPDYPNKEEINDLLVRFREEIYFTS